MDGAADAGVGAAAAEIRYRSINIRIAWLWVGFEQDGGCHHDARRAEAAHDSAFCDQRLLDGVAPVARQAFYGRHKATFDAFDGDLARHYGPSVNIDHAGAAIPRAAAIFGAGQV